MDTFKESETNEEIKKFMNIIKNEIIELQYQKYCLSFSQAYLDGSPWYQYINTYGGGSFMNAYHYCKIENMLNR